MNIYTRPLPVVRPSFLFAIYSLLIMHMIALHATSNLVKNSPFLPAGWEKTKETKAPPPPPRPPPPITPLQIEFRGVFQLKNTVPKFNIYDRTSQKSSWYALNEGNERFKVTGYDKAANSLTISANGRTEQVSMAKPDGAPVPIQSFQGNTVPIPQINQNSNTDETRKRRVVPRRRIIRRRRSSSRNESNSVTNLPSPPSLPQIPQPPTPPAP